MGNCQQNKSKDKLNDSFPNLYKIIEEDVYSFTECDENDSYKKQFSSRTERVNNKERIITEIKDNKIYRKKYVRKTISDLQNEKLEEKKKKKKKLKKKKSKTKEKKKKKSKTKKSKK